MRKIKVVHVIGSMNTGGAERMLSKLLNDKNKDFENNLIILKDEAIKYEIPEEINIYKLNLNKTNAIMSLLKFKRILDKINPDIILTWLVHSNILGWIYKRISKKKSILIWNIRHSWIQVKKMSFKKLLYSFSRVISKSVDGIIFVSNESYNAHEKNNFGNANSTVIPNGFEIPKNSKEKLCRLEMGIPKNTFLIGHVGRYHAIKNQKEILKAFNNLRNENYNVSLIMIGRGLTEENDELMNLVDTNNKKYLFMLGEQLNVDQYYNMMDIFVLTSKSEGYPNVIGESMINGTPVIATNAGDSHYILGDAGYLMKGYSHKELERIIKFTVDNPHDLVSRKDKSRKRIIDNYEINKVIKKYYDFYLKTLRG